MSGEEKKNPALSIATALAALLLAAAGLLFFVNNYFLGIEDRLLRSQRAHFGQVKSMLKEIDRKISKPAE
jgi:hypothetical protein